MMLEKGLAHRDEEKNFHQMSIATVVAYGETAGTLKIQLPYLKDKENLIEDACMMMLYAGKDYGLLLQPEIGNQVLVFLYGTARKKALVLGALPSKDTSIFQELTEENTVKLLRTKEKAEIFIQDEKDKQKLKLKTEKLELKLDEEEAGIFMQDSEQENAIKLYQKDGKVELKAKESISMVCGKSRLTLAKDGTCSIEAETVELKGKKIAVQAQNQLMLDSQKIVLDAKIQTEINGKSTLKLNSSGVLELQGSLIKIG